MRDINIDVQTEEDKIKKLKRIFKIYIRNEFLREVDKEECCDEKQVERAEKFATKISDFLTKKTKEIL